MKIRKLITVPAALALIGGAHGKLGKNQPAKPSPIVCKLQGVFDSQSHTDAYTYFLPKGWTQNSELKWGRDPGSFHVTISASTPDHEYEVIQTGNELYNFNLMRGINGQIAMRVNSPVHHATDYLKVVLEQMAQTQGFSGVEVVDEVNAPLDAEKVPKWLKNAPVPAWETRIPANETGYLQVKLTRGGQSMTAMMGTTVKGYSSTRVLPGRNTVVGEGGFFMVGPTTFLLMPSDASEQKQRESKIVASSARMTPKFRDYINELTNRLVQAKIGAFGAAQKYANDTFHERSMAQFGEQMRMKDAYSHAFCNYVSDYQDYKDRSGHIVTAPASFRYAWSDGSGNYLLNDDPTIDLRGVGNGNWQQMEKARIGD